MTIETSFSRRHFIAGTLAASAAAALGLAGCAPQGTPTAATGGDEPAAGAAAGNAPAESTPTSDVPAWLGEAPAITDADCAETVDCEVLVIGAGCSGLVAANFAAMEGAKTLLIEKFDKGTGLRGWPTGHGAMLDNGKAGKDEASGEGVTYAQVEANFLAQPNAELRYLTSLECLIKEGDKVVGAYASTDEGATFLRINAAKGVIVATGGYANNPDMYMALQADNAKGLCGVVPFGNFNAQGQGIKACLWAGAVKDENPTSMVFDRGIMRPDQLPGAPFDMDFGYFHMATQPFLKVDIEGERITNESSPYDFLIHALARKSSQRAWFDIWDSNWPTDIERFHTIGCSGLIKGEGTNQMDPEGVEGTAAIIDALVEEGKIVKADTLEEIADAFGINKETFLATVEQYNGFYDAQNDTQYGKEPFRLSEIRTAPFYACKLSGMALATLDGIKINTKFQALDENNAPIEGLYVIGNDSGNYYNGTYPNLAAGLNAGRCVTFGMLCGRQVANL